jgi:hypothetical protein
VDSGLDPDVRPAGHEEPGGLPRVHGSLPDMGFAAPVFLLYYLIIFEEILIKGEFS